MGTPSCNRKYPPPSAHRQSSTTDQSLGVARCAKELLGFLRTCALIAARERRLLTATLSMPDCARVRPAHPEADCSCLSCGAPSASVCQNGDPGGRMRLSSHRFQSCFICYLSNSSSCLDCRLFSIFDPKWVAV